MQLLSNEFFPSQNTPKLMSAGALPQTPLGELTALPRPLAGFKGAASRQEGNGGEGERRNGEGRKKGSWGGNSALVIGWIDAPVGTLKSTVER